MDRCSTCLLELIDAELLTDAEGTLRADWYAFVMENADQAITIVRGSALCIKHSITALTDIIETADDSV